METPARVEWDGIPKVVVTGPELMSLYDFLPQWVGIADGPRIPFGDGERIRIQVHGIFTETREEAAEAMDQHLTGSCAEEGMAYDPDAWTIHLSLKNAC